MKNIITTIMLLIFTPLLWSQSNDYDGGNGHIIESWQDGDTAWVIRKNEQHIQMGELANIQSFQVYSALSLETRELVYELSLGDYIDVMKIAIGKNQNTGNVSSWLQIFTENSINGWIFWDNSDPYENGQWEIVERIDLGGKIWTARKLEQIVAVWQEAELRDRPGIEGSQVISHLVPTQEMDTLMLKTLAVTEEFDTINNKTDRWIKVTDENDISGWIFGGSAGVERGGPKYLIPENRIRFYMGYL